LLSTCWHKTIFNSLPIIKEGQLKSNLAFNQVVTTQIASFQIQ
jgi:hypothetical protein